MKHPYNALAVIIALLASCTLAWIGQSTDNSSVNVVKAGVVSVRQEESVLDHNGYVILCREYQRIICASTIAAEVLPELIGVDRILMVPDWHRKQSPRSFRTKLRDKNGNPRIETLDSLASVEVLISAKPDLVLINSLNGGGGEHIQRLRSLGLNVMNLGPMLGAQTLLSNIRSLGQVLRVAHRGERLALSFERRLERVTTSVPHHNKIRALYISSMGTSLIGGTKGSSYNDLLTYAGLEDAAEDQGLSPWPNYSPEQVLDLDPDLIVTEHGHGETLRTIPGFNTLRALSRQGGLVEMPPGTNTTGLGLLDAVEALHEAVYGKKEKNTP